MSGPASGDEQSAKPAATTANETKAHDQSGLGAIAAKWKEILLGLSALVGAAIAIKEAPDKLAPASDVSVVWGSCKTDFVSFNVKNDGAKADSIMSIRVFSKHGTRYEAKEIGPTSIPATYNGKPIPAKDSETGGNLPISYPKAGSELDFFNPDLPDQGECRFFVELKAANSGGKLVPDSGCLCGT